MIKITLIMIIISVALFIGANLYNLGISPSKRIEHAVTPSKRYKALMLVIGWTWIITLLLCFATAIVIVCRVF